MAFLKEKRQDGNKMVQRKAIHPKENECANAAADVEPEELLRVHREHRLVEEWTRTLSPTELLLNACMDCHKIRS